MKKTTVGIFLISPILAFGQLKMDASGNIGIGTTIPMSRLEVNNGDLNIKAGASYANDPGDLVFMSATGVEYGRVFSFSNAMRFRANANQPGSLNIMNTTGNVSIKKLTADNSYSLDVLGNIRCNLLFQTSDSQFKKNVTPLPSSRTSNLYNLNGYTYQFDMAKYAKVSDGVQTDSSSLTYLNLKDLETIGVIAQEVKAYFPELVQESEDGILAVNYDGFIPILIESLKEQKREIELLKEKIGGQNDEDLIETRASLDQNVPNPFNNKTEITYRISSPFYAASINVYDLSGKLLVSKVVADLDGKVYIEERELYKGLFIYNLIVDGQELASKKMIVQ